MGKDQSYSMLFQDLEDRVGQVGLGAEFYVIPGIFRDLAEESV
jgi:hypothetical protein